MTIEDVIDRLREYVAKGYYTEQDLKLLCAIMEMPVWSEESHQKFAKVGFDMAVELYEVSTMNMEPYEVLTDPDNPDNW